MRIRYPREVLERDGSVKWDGGEGRRPNCHPPKKNFKQKVQRGGEKVE